jgi:hypothetical protein
MTLPEEDVPSGGEGPVEQVSTFEWDAAASASRTVTAGMEEITIDGRRWGKFGDNPWITSTLSVADQADWESRMSYAQHWGDPEVVEEELRAALPEGIALVPAQIFPVPIKAAMVPDGEEVVNGVHCRRYRVDTDLDFTQSTGTHVTGHAAGTIWVAHQDGIPPVIVRAEVEEVLTSDGRTTHPRWDFNMTDVNGSVSIRPPTQSQTQQKIP